MSAMIYFIEYTLKIMRLSVVQSKRKFAAILCDISEPTIAGYLSKKPEIRKPWFLGQAGN